MTDFSDKYYTVKSLAVNSEVVNLECPSIGKRYFTNQNAIVVKNS